LQAGGRRFDPGTLHSSVAAVSSSSATKLLAEPHACPTPTSSRKRSSAIAARAEAPGYDVLDLVRLVPGRDGETIVLSSNALVLLDRQPQACLATPFDTALAEELEQLLRGLRPHRDSLLVQTRHSLVYFARQGLVDRLSFVALLHLPQSFHGVTAFVSVFEHQAARGA
jgi:hypothetical protein